MKKGKDEAGETGVSRRRFLKVAGAAAAAAAIGVDAAAEADAQLNPRTLQKASSTQLDEGAKVVMSACLGCNARCGNRAVVKNGRLEKISGNPYHPYNTGFAQADYAHPVESSLALPATVCGKAQDAPNYLYNPYRLLRPLKRSGPRGSGKFAPIAWEQLVKEIVAGGRLFASIGDDGHYPGVRELDSDAPIDPSAPELGPVRNGFVFIAGRDQNGRQEFANRFVQGALGSINRVGHSDICGIGFRMGNFALTEKRETEMKADPVNAEYILVFGANIYEALQPGVNTYGAAVAKRHSAGKVKFTIVDPRATNASVHADDWIAIKPGHDGSFAMGVIRWILDNRRFNNDFLMAPNSAAAAKIGHACHSNASHLVIVDPDHKNARRFLRMSDLEPGQPGKSAAEYVVIGADGAPASAANAASRRLEFHGKVKTSAGRLIEVKSSFTLLAEESRRYTLQQYATFAGVEVADIERVAREFTSHGTRAAVCQYHGAGNYASGTHAAYAIAVLNALIGSVDRKGGYLKGGGAIAKWDEGLYDLKGFPGRKKPAGIRLSREKAAYEDSTEFRKKKAETGSGYPSRRPWFPFTLGGLCVETLNGIDQGYPYPCKMLCTYFFNPVYSVPGGGRYVETLKSREKVPLHVSVDVTVNETNLYADYIVPDLTYLEGHYAFLPPHAPSPTFTAVRTPVVEPLTGRTASGHPFSLETFLIDLANEAGLPGFGENAIRDRDGKRHPLRKAEEYYLRGLSNLAENAKVAEAGVSESGFVERNYPVASFREMLPGKEWRKVCTLLGRGGAFKRYGEQFDGERHLNGVRRVVLYNEELAVTRNSLTGEFQPGCATYIPPMDSTGTAIEERDAAFPFTVVTHKKALHAQSRTNSHSWSMEIAPTNHIMINEDDARKIGVRDDDQVKLVSASNPHGVTGRVKVTRQVRKGCLAISFHYGHTQHGASSLPIKDAAEVFLGGKKVAGKGGLQGNPKLGAGILPNTLSRLDDNLGALPLVDVVAGIPDFSSTRVRVVKV
jgi:tetrathionate reductase subunit A